MRIADICTYNVVHIAATASVRDAAEMMRTRHVGALVVVEQNGERIPIGIITDRDIVVSVVARGVSAESVTIGDVMTRQVATCLATEELFDAIEIMRTHRVRRLPVLNATGDLSGMVAADDIHRALGMHAQLLGQALALEQIHEMEVRP